MVRMVRMRGRVRMRGMWRRSWRRSNEGLFTEERVVFLVW
jgi:hypothetical protein